MTSLTFKLDFSELKLFLFTEEIANVKKAKIAFAEFWTEISFLLFERNLT